MFIPRTPARLAYFEDEEPDVRYVCQRRHHHARLLEVRNLSQSLPAPDWSLGSRRSVSSPSPSGRLGLRFAACPKTMTKIGMAITATTTSRIKDTIAMLKVVPSTRGNTAGSSTSGSHTTVKLSGKADAWRPFKARRWKVRRTHPVRRNSSVEVHTYVSHTASIVFRA